MILLRRRDRLGNWLFAYCFARLLALRFNYRLSSPPLLSFLGTIAEVAGDEVYGPEARWEGQWPFDAYSGRRLEWAEFFQAPGQRLILDGWFQRFEFIADVREEIRGDWLRMDEALPVRPSGDFAIGLRLGDEYDPETKKADGATIGGCAGGVLREEEVRRLVRTVGHERLYFVTDRPRHPLITALRDLRAEVVSSEAMADFRFLHSFQKVAMCQSTFHWWAAFLGEAREIYFPPCDRGPWSHPEPANLAHEPEHWGIDLRVRDEARYIYAW